MASNYEDVSDKSVSDFSDTDTDSQSNFDSDSDSASPQVCIYYNKGHCRKGTKCPDLHVCKYSLKGNCRYGASCRRSHIASPNCPSAQTNQEKRSRGRKTQSHRERSRSSSSDSDTDRSKPYRWQLDLGNGWEDVANDYVLEAQFSRPNTKGIRIYNTPCGALSIDFTSMRILKKGNLRVRRKGSRHSDWLWYYRGDHGWYLYGKKDAKGNVSPVSSTKLESEFQKDPRGTVHFTINSTNYEIRFKNMHQKNLSTGHNRRIRRRPKYVSPQVGGVNTVTNMFKSMWPSSSKKTPLWQFSGRGGNWHSFTVRDSCSVSSADIEAEFQRNPQGSMHFTANGDQYTLNFSRMIQTNQRTQATRNIRRVKQ
ncbi:protein mono-ADP-ribosyltransferase PARP12 isoform X2 [Pangasianodon hypophthalmus]|uniref:protein mono-ADP-ribosyltransferase PARP12 isoform X2 n=1 Tax=Pangasianodon hypophthalmus TaxID=310915 RepID=UPI000EFE6198|nr:protein mono-ADP-ribosyltransferase PARP12 isoform X2 [Pangasianodon hypophthalmus]